MEQSRESQIGLMQRRQPGNQQKETEQCRYLPPQATHIGYGKGEAHCLPACCAMKVSGRRQSAKASSTGL